MLYPIIRRKRRPLVPVESLQTVTENVVEKVVTTNQTESVSAVVNEQPRDEAEIATKPKRAKVSKKRNEQRE